jgi:hypothetical protein
MIHYDTEHHSTVHRWWGENALLTENKTVTFLGLKMAAAVRATVAPRQKIVTCARGVIPQSNYKLFTR